MQLIDTVVDKTIILNEILTEKQVSLEVLRLDKIHPIISGNKIFKLNFLFDSELPKNKNTIVTKGGAFSNHLVATAFAGKKLGLKNIGLVRGDEILPLNDSLQECKNYGMQLIFVPRNKFNEEYFPKENEIYIPEGGFCKNGAKGAELIGEYCKDYHFVCAAIGTATTISGILMGTEKQKIIGIPVLKGMKDIEDRIHFLTGKNFSERLIIWDNYHFGGYAKFNDLLIENMNQWYKDFQLQTDFVYTAKMFLGIMDKIENNYFPKGSKILAIHSGGLQGNRSIKHLLNF